MRALGLAEGLSVMQMAMKRGFQLSRQNSQCGRKYRFSYQPTFDHRCRTREKVAGHRADGG